VSATPYFDTLAMHEGSYTEAKGIIKGKNSTYYIIKSLHGGCQSSCFLVSKEHDDGGDLFFVAKVRMRVFYFKFKFASTRICLLGPTIYVDQGHDKPGSIITLYVRGAVIRSLMGSLGIVCAFTVFATGRHGNWCNIVRGAALMKLCS
jgi:hypothetical protein